MGKKIFGGLVAVIALFLAYVAFQPADYTIAREIKINASAEKIFPFLNSSKLAEKWGPWSEIDPEAKMVFSGPEEGVGAQTSWDTGKQLGTGSATIAESVLNQKVGIKLEYTKPMNMTQYAEYLITPADTGSIVTWKVQGKNSFVGRIMCVFVNMDKMVGGMFEKGLSNLKNLVEK